MENQEFGAMLSKGTFENLLSTLIRRIEMTRSHIQTKPCCLLYQCLNFYSLHSYGKLLEYNEALVNKISQKFLFIMKKNWIDASLAVINNSKTEEAIVSKAIELAGLDGELRNRIFVRNPLIGNLFYCDLQILPNIIVEINGPYHYISKLVLEEEKGSLLEYQLTPNYKIKVKVLELMGFKVIQLKNTDFLGKLSNPALIKDYIQKNIFSRLIEEK